MKKNLTLRPGEWKVATNRDDESKYLSMKTANFDYYINSEGDMLLLNGNSDEWTGDNSVGNIKAGYFDGDLPDLKAQE